MKQARSPNGALTTKESATGDVTAAGAKRCGQGKKALARAAAEGEAAGASDSSARHLLPESIGSSVAVAALALIVGTQPSSPAWKPSIVTD